MTQTLAGKKGLVVGIANEHSIAWGCAKAFQAEGAELAVTYLNVKAEPYVRPLAQQVNASLILPLDVRDDAQMEAVFNAVKARWGKLDFLLHAIAFAPQEDLQGRWAADDGRRLPAHHEQLRRRASRRALQHNGAGEIGAGRCGQVSRGRNGQEPHPRQRPVAGADPDAGSGWAGWLRRVDTRGAAQVTAPRYPAHRR